MENCKEEAIPQILFPKINAYGKYMKQKIHEEGY